MEIGKEECQAKVTFEVGKSSRSGNRGRVGMRGRGRRRRGKSRLRQDNHGEMENTVREQKKRGIKSIRRVVHDVEKAYNRETNEDIRKIIEALENKVLEEPSDLDMEEWNSQLPNPGNTCGRLTLY